MAIQRRGPDLPVLALLLLAVVLVFAQTSTFAFVTLDDNHYVVENAKVWRGFSADNLEWALTTTFFGLWHPLAWLSHMLDAEVWGNWAGGHHVSSVLIHYLASAFLYLFFREATNSTGKSALVALLFAIHPLHVESVAWISERKDVLCGMFWILAMVAHGRYSRAPSLRAYLWTMLWAALALLSKPMAVTLPVALLLLDIWPLRRLSSDASRIKALLRLAAEKIPLAMVVAVYFFTFLLEPVASKDMLPLSLRLANVGLAYWTYLYQTLLPLDLACYYPMVMDPSAWLAPVALGAIAVLLVGLWLLPASWSWLPVGFAWFVVTLVPVIGFFPVAAHAHADRYTYLPLIGILAAIAWSIPIGTHRWRRILVALGVAALMVLAFKQVQSWRDSESLFSHAVAVNRNNFFAHQYLAEEYVTQGRLEEARAHATKAISLAQGQDLEYAIWIIYGDIQMARNKPQEALRLYDNARSVDPRRATAYDGIGTALLAVGSGDSARQYFTEALRRNPTRAATLSSLGMLAIESGRREDARRYLELAMLARPANAAAIERTARLAARLGNPEQASELLRRGRQLFPKNAALGTAARDLGVI